MSNSLAVQLQHTVHLVQPGLQHAVAAYLASMHITLHGDCMVCSFCGLFLTRELVNK